MKILLLCNQHFKKAFEQLGHKVIGITGDSAERCDVRKHNADLIIVHESLGNRQLPHGIEQAHVPTVFYSVDVHLNLYWHREYAQIFDYVFVSQKDYVQRLQHDHAYWLPWSVDPETFRECLSERKYDIVFVGTINSSRRKRKNIISELAKRFNVKLYGINPMHRLSKTEMAQVYSQAKIIINESIFKEVTFRTFEAPACGGMLLTERVENGLCDLFEDGKDAVMFDRHDFIEKADYYLKNDRERRSIADSGKSRVHREHTFVKRAETMLQILNENRFQKRKKSADKTVLHYAKALFLTAGRFPRNKERRLKRAEIMFKKVMTVNAYEQETRFFLTLAYAVQNRAEEALQLLRQQLQRAKTGNAAYRAELCSLAYALGHTAEAVELLKNLQPLFNQKTDSFYLSLGSVLEQQEILYDAGNIGSNDIPLNAVDCYVKSMSSEGLYAAGLILYMLALFDGACEYLEKALSADRKNRCIKKALALAYLETYDMEKAFEQLKDVMNVRDVDGISELVQHARKRNDRRVSDIIDILEKRILPAAV